MQLKLNGQKKTKTLKPVSNLLIKTCCDIQWRGKGARNGNCNRNFSTSIWNCQIITDDFKDYKITGAAEIIKANGQDFFKLK